MEIKGSEVDQEIVPYVASQSMWVAGDVQKSVLFEFSRAGAQVMQRARDSKLFWLGNAAIFGVANVLGAGASPSLVDWTSQVPMSPGMLAFSAITSVGFSASAVLGYLGHLRQGDYTKMVETDLDSIVAPIEKLQERAKLIEGGQITPQTQFVLSRLAKLRQSKQDGSPKGPGSHREP